MPVMPRGKRTVFAMFCSENGSRIGTIRLLKQNSKGKSWKDLKLTKYCRDCRKKVPVKTKEEKHSS